MRFAKYLILLALLASPVCTIFAAPFAALELCVFSDGKEFRLSTKNPAEADQLGFQKFKETTTFIRPFTVLVDGRENNSFKPLDKKPNCVRINKIPAGKHSVSINLKTGAYTMLETVAPLVLTFKEGLLFNGKINVAKGSVATVEIHQQKRRIELYQAVTDQPVPDCEFSCEVPTGVPLYFVEKPTEDKEPCRPAFQLIVENERDKNLGCYDKKAIETMLEKHIQENNILCNPDAEVAFFRVFGEGCVVSPAVDPEGIGVLPPQIRTVPVQKDARKYFVARYPKEKEPYILDNEKKGPQIIPEKDEIIEFFEEKD